MRQRVTLGYFTLDVTGIRRPIREDVIVDAATGDEAAAMAIAQNASRIAEKCGYGPDGQAKIGVLGIEPAGNEPAPQPAMQGADDNIEPASDAPFPKMAANLPPVVDELPVLKVKRGPGRPPKVRVNAV